LRQESHLLIVLASLVSALHVSATEEPLALHVAAASLRQLAWAATDATLRHALWQGLLAAHLATPEEPLALHVAAAGLRQLARAAADAALWHTACCAFR